MRRRRRVLVVVGAFLLLSIAVGLAIDQAQASPVVNVVRVGVAPDPLVVDEVTSRAFVYNGPDATLSTLDTHTGALVRTVPVGASYAWLAVARRTGRLFVSSGGDGSITMLDARWGVVLRVLQDTEVDVRQIAVDEGSSHVFLGHRDTNIVTMLDAQQGTILRHVTVRCFGAFGVAVSQRTDHVFIKCNDGGIDMLDGRTGRVLRDLTTPLGEFGGALADEPTNRIFVSDDGTAPFGTTTFVVLDARTGALLHTVNTGSNLGNGIIDPRNGHVYMTLGGGQRAPGGTGAPGRDAGRAHGGAAAPLHGAPQPVGPGVRCAWLAALGGQRRPPGRAQ